MGRLDARSPPVLVTRRMIVALLVVRSTWLSVRGAVEAICPAALVVVRVTLLSVRGAVEAIWPAAGAVGADVCLIW